MVVGRSVIVKPLGNEQLDGESIEYEVKENHLTVKNWVRSSQNSCRQGKILRIGKVNSAIFVDVYSRGSHTLQLIINIEHLSIPPETDRIRK